jgi:CHAT domain-containing protein
VLPAVSSLTSLRRFAEARHATNPFVGFGDPDFCGGKVESVQVKGIQTVNLFDGGAANVDGGLRHLPLLPPLPDTASELRAVAQALRTPPSSVHLQHDATVTKVKSLDLSDVRVVAFATHGLVAGDLPALTEPALALTRPAEPTEEDDGLLRASDMPQLKLNADWVVLSACNTAAADGTPGAEGLSGLAKAFFYAGARSLLVSHWPVDSAATVKLTTSAFRALNSDKRKSYQKIGRAEAFRRAMLAMIDGAGKSTKTAYEAHPLYWAPFVVVGEGGNGR